MKSKRTPSTDLETIMPLLIGVWRRMHKEAGPADVLQTREFRGVVEAVKKLQAGFDGKQSLIGTNYFSDRNYLGAYLLYQWVVHYQEGLSLIGELPHAPKRVLDVCSGPGAYAFAALRHGANEVIATDISKEALEIGAQICGRYGMPLATRLWNCLKDPLPVEGKFDLIILGHCLQELFPSDVKGWPDHQHRLVTYLLNRLTPNGYLLIADSSYIDANNRILQLRDNLVKEGVPVQAPCVWKGECPALKMPNSPCYAQRQFDKPFLIKEIQRAADIKLGSLKMTYIIFKSPQSQWPELPEDVSPNYRIISPPVETYQGNRFYLCGTDGKKTLGSHLKEYPAESRAFEYLKRGELIYIEDGLRKDNAIDIVKGTKLQVIAPLGKPIPEKSTDS